MHVACARADAASSWKLYFHSARVPLPRHQCKPLWEWVALEGAVSSNPAGKLEREGPEAAVVPVTALL